MIKYFQIHESRSINKRIENEFQKWTQNATHLKERMKKKKKKE